jgi:photosystem II stability/assembly factor-like uncharacterized protein
MRALHFLSDNYGWAVGDNATILRWDGELWSEVLVFTDENLLGVYLTDVREGWAVGSKGTILHWNGISWDAEVSPLAETLMSVKPSPKGTMQIITQSGVTLVREAGIWLVQSSDVTIPELSAKGTK